MIASSPRAARSVTAILGVWLLLTLLVVPSGCAPSASASPKPAISLEPCQLSAPGSPVRMAAKCGSLAVYEDRAAGTGRQINLHIAVIPTISRNPAPDPLFFLAGGPGEAATQSFLSMASAFDEMRQKRDIVLVDQRGTGESNPLLCPEMSTGDSSIEVSDEKLAEAEKACLDQLDANPAFYTTSIAMDDLDQVREALGYSKIDLYGISYGTRAAMTYLRQHGDRVRTVILDGAYPSGLALGPQAAASAQRALDLMFDRCAADSGCSKQFPQVRSEFDALMSRLKQQPARLSLRHPITGEMTDITFTADMLAVGIRMLSYSTETVALLPRLIHSAQGNGDLTLLAAQTLMVTEGLDSSISEGMNLSVMCSEDAPFFTSEEAARLGSGSYLGDGIAQGMLKACSKWPRGEIPADFGERVSSGVPTLLLSGEADPVTPPANGEFAAETLSNSLHLVAPGQGHGVIFRGCLPKVAAAFVEKGTVEGLNTGCVAEIQAAPFFTSFAGPEP